MFVGNRLFGPKFGRVHVLSRQVNQALAKAYRTNTIPAALPSEARLRMQQGEGFLDSVMGDDKSNKMLYYSLNDGRGIIITNKDTPDIQDFRAMRKQYSGMSKSTLCNIFLTAKSIVQQIHWVYGDQEKP